MAYGLSSNYLQKSRYTSKGKTMATLPKQSSSNKPVRKAYKKRAPSSKTGQNKTAIMTLSRQVKGLQNSKYGDMQRHAQYCTIIGSRLPNRAQPLAFLLNDLTLGSSIYAGYGTCCRYP